MALYCTLITKRNLHKNKGCNHHNANDRFGIKRRQARCPRKRTSGFLMVSIDRQVLACRMQCTARTDAVHCRGGCSALRERLQCTASEMEKTGTEKASPILDKKLGRKDGSTRDTLGLPQDISAKPLIIIPSVFTMAFMTHTVPSPVSFQYHCSTNQKTLQYQ